MAAQVEEREDRASSREQKNSCSLSMAFKTSSVLCKIPVQPSADRSRNPPILQT